MPFHVLLLTERGKEGKMHNALSHEGGRFGVEPESPRRTPAPARERHLIVPGVWHTLKGTSLRGI